jgi:hypothetical protein
MYGNLQIDGDPTVWLLDQPADITQWTGETVSVAVKAPLIGTLLLSTRVASVAAFTQAHALPAPNALTLPMPAIYLPTAAGPSADSAGYVLPLSVDLTNLAGEISAAMSAGSQLTIDFGLGPSSGVLLVSGASLPFVVLCPVNDPLGQPSGGGGVPND